MQAVYYRAADGSEPVDAFIETLRDPDRQAALDNQIERLNMLRPNDPPPPFPWSSQLEGELRARRSPGYRAARERLAPYEQLARIVIRRRMELGLTQEQLAERMGTSHSAISRIESGQHSTSVQTLQRLAAALEMRFVMGFEHG